MEPECVLSFMVGASIGFVIGVFAYPDTSRYKKSSKRKKDPANWWKHGGDPFNYDEESE
jgi:hypothetical protein